MAESIASEPVITPARKRGRPAKIASAPVISSLTRTTRKTSKPRQAQKTKAITKTVVAPAKISMLNRVVNITVVAAVFVTALAIQRIVPTEAVTTPKVEALPQTAVAAPTVTPAPAPEAAATTPAPTVAPAPAPVEAAPAPVAAKVEPVKTVSSKKHAAVAKATRRNAGDVATPLNSGGSQDLDAEAARANYMATSKLATRAAQPAPAPKPAK